ncbi:MAG: MFS transporter [Pseudomonadota bacterium]
MAGNISAEGERKLGVGPILAACTAVQALLAMAMLAIAAVGPALAADLGLDAGLVGYQITTVYVTAVLCSLVAGDAVARFGAIRAMQVALAFAATGLTLAAVPSVPVIVLGSLVIGAGYGLTNPAAAHLLARATTERNRNLVFSIKQTGVPLGAMLAGLVIPGITVTAGWRTALVVGALGCLCLLAAIQSLRATNDADRNPTHRLAARPFAALQLVWRTRDLRRLVVACLTFSAVQLMIMGYTVTLLVEEFAFGLVAAGAVLALVQAAGVVGRLVWGTVADRWLGGPRTLSLTAITSAAACLALGFASWLPPEVVPAILVVLGFTAIGWNGVYVAEVARIAGHAGAGQATGGAMTVVFVGTIVGPSAFAIAYGLIGSFTTTFGVASLLLMIGAWLIGTLARDSRLARTEAASRAAGD